LRVFGISSGEADYFRKLVPFLFEQY